MAVVLQTLLGQLPRQGEHPISQSAPSESSLWAVFWDPFNSPMKQLPSELNFSLIISAVAGWVLFVQRCQMLRL